MILGIIILIIIILLTSALLLFPKCPDGYGLDFIGKCVECTYDTYSKNNKCVKCPDNTHSDKGSTECLPS